MSLTAPVQVPTIAAGPRPIVARAEHAVKVYGRGETTVRALDDVTIDFESGRFTAIMGPSGSGKSTLLHCLAGLDRLTSGAVYIGDTELGDLSDRDLTHLRRDCLGAIVGKLGLGDRLRHRPSELSGGQQQRVAAARAMITRPELIFADEPTGNLDSRSADDLLQSARASVDGFGQTIVMVTHDP